MRSPEQRMAQRAPGPELRAGVTVQSATDLPPARHPAALMEVHGTGRNQTAGPGPLH